MFYKLLVCFYFLKKKKMREEEEDIGNWSKKKNLGVNYMPWSNLSNIIMFYI